MQKNKTLLIALVAAALLGGGTLYMGRNFIADSKIEKIDQNPTSETILSTPPKKADIMAAGNFIEIDKVHKGIGSATISKSGPSRLLSFSSDFAVTSGPDLVIYLSKNNVEKGEELGDIVSLGKLKSNTGMQTYNLPEDVSEFKSVVIWCRAFGVLFSAAPIEL